MFTRTLLKPTQTAEVHCANCDIYKNRIEDAERIEELFGTEGEWDYVECSQVCERVRRREQHDCKLNRRG